MRTSAQIDRSNDNCKFNKHTSLTTSSDNMIKSYAVKSIIKRLLEGEPIEDIPMELDSICSEKKLIWENYEQRMSYLFSSEKDIKKYVTYRMKDAANMIPTSSLDKTVDYFGEQIEAKADYFIVDGENVTVLKIKTSKMPPRSDRATASNETYCLAKLGEKYFPNKNIIVEYDYLKDDLNSTRLKTYSPDEPYENHNKIDSVYITGSIKSAFEIKHQQEEEAKEKQTHSCSKEDCASCSMNNICNYEEAPLSISAEAIVSNKPNPTPTASQRDVINFNRGIARVNAGAGAGKTMTVSKRVAKLIEDGVEPEKICLLTFTKTGAEEMTERAMREAANAGTPIDPEKLTSTTINAFCQKIITDNYQTLGYTRAPRVIPDANRFAIINRIIDTYPKISNWVYGMSLKNLPKWSQANIAFNMAVEYFDTIKREGYTRENNPYGFMYGIKDLNNIFLMYDAYQSALKSQNLIEYDDQLKLVFKLLELKPDLFEELGYEHILVDEFQDTDGQQIELLNKIIDTTKFKSFMAVGDDSQSIFGFRHTSPEYMINFENYFGRFSDFPLLENHRSTKPIIDFANKVNSHAQEKIIKDLIPTKLSDVNPTVQGFYSKDQEHTFIANDIKKRWDNGERDIAVLTSDRFEIQNIASKLTELGIPSVSMNPVPFMENCRVSALLSFYDAFMGRSTQGFADYQNVLAGGRLKDASKEQIELISEDFALDVEKEDKSLETFKSFARALDEQNLDEVYKDFCEQLDFCENTDELHEFIENFKIYGNKAAHKREGKYDGICLITVHSAKGLEWDTTYLTLSSFDRPSEANSMNGFDEKIRKFFVGATRARENLIMTGTYVIGETSKCRGAENRFLQLAYDDLGKTYDYSPAQHQLYLADVAKKKEEASKSFTVQLNNISVKSKIKLVNEDEEKNKEKMKEIYKDGHKPKASVKEEEAVTEDIGLD